MYKSEHIITAKHYLVLCVSAFAAGIFLAVSQGCAFASTLIFVVFYISLCISIPASLIRFSKFRKKYILLPIILALFAFLGIFRIYASDTISRSSIKNYQNQEAWVYGTVASEPRLTSSQYYYSFELDVFRINDNKHIRGTMIIYTPESRGCHIQAGDNIFCWTKIENPETREQALNHDYYTHLKSKNIFLTGNTKNINPLIEEPGFSLISSVKNLGVFTRRKISSAIDQIFDNNKVSAAVLKGILIGDKSGFDDDLYNKFSNSGISHIVAVSGLHTSILFSFLLVIWGALPINRKFTLAATIPFIILFMSASAFTPSVCRASIMLMIVIISSLLGEEYSPVTSLFLALGSILAAVPFALFSKSLVLSFSATLGIFVYFPYMNEFLKIPILSPKADKLKGINIIRKALMYLSSSLSLSCASLIGTGYFLLIFFGKISKVQFLTNLWVIPLVTLIFCLGYITCIVYYIFPYFALNILKYPLALFLKVIKLTINAFGSDSFAYELSAESFNAAHAAIYFGGALIVYMLLKAFHDMRKEKEITAGKSDR